MRSSGEELRPRRDGHDSTRSGHHYDRCDFLLGRVRVLIILGVLKIVNFAHGGFLTFGGYSALVVTQPGRNPWLAYPASFLTGILLGAVVERFVVRPLYDRPVDAILATWGLASSSASSSLSRLAARSSSCRHPSRRRERARRNLFALSHVLILAAAVVAAGIHMLFSATRLGLEARAVIMNEPLARGLGINSGYVRFVTFCIGAGLASLAGALITPLSSVDPNMGVPWLVNAFMLVLVRQYRSQVSRWLPSPWAAHRCWFPRSLAQ